MAMGEVTRNIAEALINSLQGGVYMIPRRLSYRRKLAPVPSRGSVFLYHQKMSYRNESYRREFTLRLVVAPEREFRSGTNHVNDEQPLASV